MSGFVSCLDASVNNKVSEHSAEALRLVGSAIAAVALVVAAVVLMHLAISYLHTVIGTTTGVSSTAVSTILNIARWSGVAAAAGLSLGLISMAIDSCKQKVVKEAGKES